MISGTSECVARSTPLETGLLEAAGTGPVRGESHSVLGFRTSLSLALSLSTLLELSSPGVLGALVGAVE